MDPFGQLIAKITKLVAEHGLSVLLTAFFFAAILPIVRLLIRRFLIVRTFFQTRSRALAAVGRLKTSGGKIEGDGPWAMRPFGSPDDYQQGIAAHRILCLANYKGGVGKTTLAANLGACLASKHNFKVLLIDLDFQGSLSAMVFAGQNWQPQNGEDSAATGLVSGDYTANELLKIASKVKGCENLSVVKAHYDLAQADTRILVEWLLSPKPKKPSSWSRRIGDLYYGKIYQPQDPRFNLARLLHTTSMLEAYDIVIIDCPPRVTSGSVQAFCASSHVLVPAIMDQTSSEAVVRFFQQLDDLKNSGLCPHIRDIGIVPTKYQDRVSSRRAVEEIKNLSQRNRLDAKIVDTSCYIPHKAGIIDAQEEGIAYLHLGEGQRNQDLKDSVEALTKHVIESVGITHRAT